MNDILFAFISKYVSLTQEEKEAIIELDIFRSFKKGAILLKEGEHSKNGYFVLKGCIRKYYIIEGDEKTTSFYTELEGEVPECVISNKASTYYLSCIEDSIVSTSTPEMEEEEGARLRSRCALARVPRVSRVPRVL